MYRKIMLTHCKALRWCVAGNNHYGINMWECEGL